MALKTILRGIGFRDAEARVYLACLELGESPASRIAKKARMKRPSVYVVLKELGRHGHVSSYTRRGVTVFAAHDPKAIVAAAVSRARAAEAALPELTAITEREDAAKPHVRFYEDIEGIKAILADTIANPKHRIDRWSDVEFAEKVLGRAYREEYHRKRIDQRIPLRSILEDNQAARTAAGRSIRELHEVRVIPADQYDFNDEIMIYGDKLAIISYPDHLGLIVQNRAIADTQRAIFKLCWERAGALGPSR